jgi:hypothetical protein
VKVLLHSENGALAAMAMARRSSRGCIVKTNRAELAGVRIVR